MGSLEDFDVARTEFARLVVLVSIESLEDRTPCTEWSLRQLLNHVVTGTQWFTTVVLGEPRPDREPDQILSDPSGAFARRADEFRAAMAAPGALEGAYTHPVGEVSGERYTLMRVNEYLCHGWDLATTIGATPNFPSDIAKQCLALVESQMEGRTREAGKGFGVALDPGPSPSDYERLIAFVGRSAADW
ncbi:MAG TPA: TIGR03086 family metal-binding protein [Acidimicrobiales bacterium]